MLRGRYWRWMGVGVYLADIRNRAEPPLFYAGSIEFGPQFGVTLTKYGMLSIGCDFGKRFQNEGIPGDVIAWQCELSFLENLVAI